MTQQVYVLVLVEAEDADEMIQVHATEPSHETITAAIAQMLSYMGDITEIELADGEPNVWIALVNVECNPELVGVEIHHHIFTTNVLP